MVYNKFKMQQIKDTIDARAYMEKFKGFSRPNTTPTPDELFDIFLTELTHAQLKVLLYIVRRTYGFQKDSDSISLSQISSGIVIRTGKNKGKQLDRGAGITKRGAIKAVQELEKKGLIVVSRRKTEDGYNNVNIYKLRFKSS